MSYGISDRIFLIVHRTFLFSYLRGCWLLIFFFLCSKYWWTKNERAIEIELAAVEHGLEFRDETKLLARKRYRIWLDSFLYLSWCTATKNTPFAGPACFELFVLRWPVFMCALFMFLNRVFRQEWFNRFPWFFASLLKNGGTLRKCYLFYCSHERLRYRHLFKTTFVQKMSQ